jgi:hypothetical protein
MSTVIGYLVYDTCPDSSDYAAAIHRWVLYPTVAHAYVQAGLLCSYTEFQLVPLDIVIESLLHKNQYSCVSGTDSKHSPGVFIMKVYSA